VKDDLIYLEHILECIEWIRRFTAGGREEFMSDRVWEVVGRDPPVLWAAAAALLKEVGKRTP
jgi:hypothetical protein